MRGIEIRLSFLTSFRGSHFGDLVLMTSVDAIMPNSFEVFIGFRCKIAKNGTIDTSYIQRI